MVFAYSDVAHIDVMHKASIVMAAGADFRLAGPAATMLRSTKPVVGIGAVRTGCGKSQTTRAVGRLLLDAGLRVALIRHPMPYGDLEAMRVQRFATLADIDASNPTVEEREEYEAPVEMGMVMYAGVDYEGILRAAEQEADVIVWDGGNNDFPFVRPDLMITVVDPLRPGHESSYHPGETTLRIADVVVVNKVDSADPADVERVVEAVGRLVPDAVVIRAESPVTLESGESLAGQRVLVVEDGPDADPRGHALRGRDGRRAGGRAPRRSSIRGPTPSGRSPPPTRPTRAPGRSCRRWATATSSWPTSRPRSGPPRWTWSCPGRRWTWDGSSPWTSRCVRASYVLQEIGSPTLADVLAPYIAQWSDAIWADVSPTVGQDRHRAADRVGHVDRGMHPSIDPVTLMCMEMLEIGPVATPTSPRTPGCSTPCPTSVG